MNNPYIYFELKYCIFKTYLKLHQILNINNYHNFIYVTYLLKWVKILFIYSQLKSK